MDIRDLRDHLDSRLDRVEGKLDSHLERIAKAETDLSWVRGHVKIVTTVAVTVFTGMVGLIYRLLFP